jgi:hypothetical protein
VGQVPVYEREVARRCKTDGFLSYENKYSSKACR